MAIQNGFFKSINGDRRYLAEFFTSYFASFIGNGVFPNPSTNLQVINNQNFSTVVRPGKGWINGHYLNNDDNIVINHQPPDGVLRRIDRIVFSVNLDSRSMDIYLKQGTPSSAAVAPALIRNSTLYELALADIAFNPGMVSISQSNITDQRMNKALCGIVHGVVEQLDTTTLFNQYQQFLVDKGVEFDQQLAVNQQVFDDWFAQLNDILDGDVAANLANMIVTHTNNATPQKHIEVVDAIPQNLANKGLLLVVDDVDNPYNPPEIPTSIVLSERIDDVNQQLAQKAKQYYVDMVEDYGAFTDGVTNNKDVLMNAFSNIQDNTEVFFPKGTYFLNNPNLYINPLDDGNPGNGNSTTFASLIGKKNITIKGEEGTKILVNQDITLYSLWVFAFYGCENITIKNIEIDYTATGNPNVMTHPLTNITSGIYAETRAGLIRFDCDNLGAPCKNINITDNKFRLYHSQGGYVGSDYVIGSTSYSGSGKLIGILLYGKYENSELDSSWCENIIMTNNIFRETQGRVVWGWVVKNMIAEKNKFLGGCGGVRPCFRFLHGARDIQIISNTFELSNNRKTGTNHEGAIVIQHNNGTHYRKNITIKDNKIVTQHGAGIDIQGVDGAFINNNEISLDPNYVDDLTVGGSTYSAIRLLSNSTDDDYKKTRNIIVSDNRISNKQFGVYAYVFDNVLIKNNNIDGCNIGVQSLNYSTSVMFRFTDNIVSKCKYAVYPQINNASNLYHHFYSQNVFTGNEYGFYGFLGSQNKIMYLLFNHFSQNTIASLHRYTGTQVKSVGGIWNDAVQIENGGSVPETALY